MKVIIFGGTGFIGTELQKTLINKGHSVELCDVRKDSSYANKVKESEAVINLGGYPLFKKRWSTKVMAAIYDSRIDSTRQIVDAIEKAQKENKGPKVFLNASAIGYYGKGKMNEVFDEKSASSTDFLAMVCREWEEEAIIVQHKLNIRTVITRFGVVLGKDGGALDKLLPVFRFMQGTLLGNGEQPFSWVHIEDVAGIICYAIENEKVQGVYNVVAPNVVSNKEFSNELAKALHKPQVGLMGPECYQKGFGYFVKSMLFILVGGAAEVIANGQNVSSKKIQNDGYKFHYSKIDDALKSIV